jgi:hypothetical protein
VIAFDLGLKATGIAWDGGSDVLVCPNKFHKSPMTLEREHARFAWWRDSFHAQLWNGEIESGTTIAVEAPIIHRQNPTGAIGLVMLHGILRAVAIDHGHTIVTVTPAELKRWATGKGNADKYAMLAAARVRGWHGDDHNEADAYLLHSMVSTQGIAA